MNAKRNHWLGGEMIVLGAFASAVLVGLAYGVFATVVPRDTPATEAVPVPVAPTQEEYRTEAVAVMADFWQQSANVTAEGLRNPDPRFVEIVTKTQERLLRVRVPKEDRDAHLTFVLLLDQWKRALNGSTLDQERVFEKSETVRTANPWIVALPR
jgi:hypothetical protein